MKTIYGLWAIVMFYLWIMLILAWNWTATLSNTWLWKVFADITFDSQDPNKWYNAENPTASVQVSANAEPTPVSITVISTDSH